MSLPRLPVLNNSTANVTVLSHGACRNANPRRRRPDDAVAVAVDYQIGPVYRTTRAREG